MWVSDSVSLSPVRISLAKSRIPLVNPTPSIPSSLPWESETEMQLTIGAKWLYVFLDTAAGFSSLCASPLKPASFDVSSTQKNEIHGFLRCQKVVDRDEYITNKQTRCGTTALQQKLFVFQKALTVSFKSHVDWLTHQWVNLHETKSDNWRFWKKKNCNIMDCPKWHPYKYWITTLELHIKDK